jgi:transposase-like protein
METIAELIEGLAGKSGGGSSSAKLVAEDGRNGGMFACPYCKEETDVPGANLRMVFAASAHCEHCGKQFVIVEYFPMTEVQYQAAVRPLSATA